ncbi:MAG: YwiC-like family protein [Planctomycetaceae bacterium]|nr:YwiC-like family protein [Planctomycetaceae bacterium]
MSLAQSSPVATVRRFPAASRSASPARLHPKEHGAYAILGVPLVTALLIVELTPVTALVSIATVAGFLAHEPWLILSGVRGRLTREATPLASRALVVRLTIATACGAGAFWLSEPLVRLGMLVFVIFAAVEFALSSTGHGRTLVAQLMALAVLALPGAVVLLAGGVDFLTAAEFWLIWAVGRVATTVSVRSAIMRHKVSPSGQALRIGDGLLVSAGVISAVGIATGSLQWMATIPLILAAVALRIWSPHPRHLKRTGWSLLAVNVFAGIMLFWIGVN